MWSLLTGCLIVAAGGGAALLLGRHPRFASAAAASAVWVGCLAAVAPVTAALTNGPPAVLSLAWGLPWGAFTIRLDALSAFFMLPLLILAPLAALYGRAYGKESAGTGWFCFNLLVASMVLLISAADAVLFLVAWETMAIASFLLVVTEHRLGSVRKAGWIYLVATHMGAAALLVFFALLGGQAGSFAFDRFCALGGPAPTLATPLFALALVGFGSKAGIVPLHIWLPEAHPAAPSHVSALMSGVMIKTGIYGLLRALTFLAPAPPAWGWTLVILGLAGGIFGAALALAQNDMKRLLAYSSVENIGIICLALGAGLLGVSWHMPALAALGVAGALVHVLNHALAKGLLFFGAGSVLHATGSRQMDQLGGLLKSMSWTGFSFLAGAAALSALPPFNGFAGELLIYLAGVRAGLSGTTPAIALAALLLAGLALIGGLAAAGFTKAVGTVFLGEPRSRQAARSHEAVGSMRWPMVLLAALCLIIGLAAPLLLSLAAPASRVVTGSAAAAPPALWTATGAVLLKVSWTAVGLLLLAAVLFLTRRKLAADHRLDKAGGATWDCGYARPTARMQYTGSSYSQPLVELLGSVVHPQHHGHAVSGYFPRNAGFATQIPDIARQWLFAPLFRFIARSLSPLLALQHGRIHLYVLYVAVVLIALLILKGGL
jgi:formate hydrogenlyase subunit 3/multisubunit Na+/H+ antiporter MnhD subunit